MGLNLQYDFYLKVTVLGFYAELGKKTVNKMRARKKIQFLLGSVQA